jgi:hypothetical protein
MLANSLSPIMAGQRTNQTSPAQQDYDPTNSHPTSCFAIQLTNRTRLRTNKPTPRAKQNAATEIARFPAHISQAVSQSNRQIDKSLIANSKKLVQRQPQIPSKQLAAFPTRISQAVPNPIGISTNRYFQNSSSNASHKLQTGM